MELVEGDDLSVLISRGAMTPSGDVSGARRFVPDESRACTARCG
jgi:hypothetical protein